MCLASSLYCRGAAPRPLHAVCLCWGGGGPGAGAAAALRWAFAWGPRGTESPPLRSLRRRVVQQAPHPVRPGMSAPPLRPKTTHGRGEVSAGENRDQGTVGEREAWDPRAVLGGTPPWGAGLSWVSAPSAHPRPCFLSPSRHTFGRLTDVLGHEGHPVPKVEARRTHSLITVQWNRRPIRKGEWGGGRGTNLNRRIAEADVRMSSRPSETLTLAAHCYRAAGGARRPPPGKAPGAELW